MAKNKTAYTTADVHEFVNAFANTDQKKSDSFALIKLLQEITGEEPRMWGPSIIGFGIYHYKYKSGHEGEAPVLAFSPRKAAFSLYIYADTEKSNAILPKLGKFKKAKGCIYVHKLADINIPVLEDLCKETIRFIGEHHVSSCSKKY